MKRVFALLTGLCLVLSACAGGPGAQPSPSPAAEKTPQELAQAYTQAIQGARDDEMNEYFPVMTPDSEADATEREMTFAVLGFTPEDVQTYAITLSLMNVNAYAIVAVKPAEGKEETVKTGLENYMETQKASFEHYLEDQYEIAASAKLETLDDSTLLLVMSEGQDTVLESIKSALAG